METRANNALIGLFTLAVIAAAFGFVYWFARAADNGAVQTYRVVFAGSITGLSVGSSVLFNGIRVGEVKSLDLMPKNPSTVIGTIAIKNGTPIKIDTRARLEFQGLTGAAYVQLVGGKSESPALEPAAPGEIPILYAERSEFQNLLDGSRDTVAQAAQTLARLDKWLATNDANLTRTVENAATFSQSLADNSKNVSDFLAATGDAARRVGALADSLNGMTADVTALLKAVDPQKIQTTLDNLASASSGVDGFVKALDAKQVNATLANLQNFSKTLADARDPLAAFARDASSLTAKLNDMAPKLEAGLASFDKIAGAVDPEAVSRTLANVDKFTASLGSGAQMIDDVIKDTRTLAQNLAAMTPKLDAALDGFNRLTTAFDSETLNRLIGNLDTFGKTLAANTGSVDSFMRDAGEIGRKLNASADMLDDVLKGIQTMTSSPDGKGMFTDIGEAARAIRDLAIKLDARTAEITRSISDFAGAGLRDYKQLAVDGQQTLKTLDRTLRALQRDPQQVIFGPRSSIPEYKGP